MTTYPYGYARPPGGGPQGMGTMLTWEQMLTKATVRNLHPEVLRRFKALIERAAAMSVPLGVGTGWRIQPGGNRPGFAKPGNSWHESCPVLPTSASALAIDTVPNISWDWLQQYAGRYGFRTFRYVNNEPWHIQPSEIPTGRKYARTLPPLIRFPLPDDKPPPTPTPDDDEDEMIFDGFWRNTNDPNGAVYAIFKDGTKQWMTDTSYFNAAKALWTVRGAPPEALDVREQSDNGMFAAFGLVLGPRPGGTDEWGNYVG